MGLTSWKLETRGSSHLAQLEHTVWRLPPLVIVAGCCKQHQHATIHNVMLVGRNTACCLQTQLCAHWLAAASLCHCCRPLQRALACNKASIWGRWLILQNRNTSPTQGGAGHWIIKYYISGTRIKSSGAKSSLRWSLSSVHGGVGPGGVC
jgi:hypothetical protein